MHIASRTRNQLPKTYHHGQVHEVSNAGKENMNLWKPKPERAFEYLFGAKPLTETMVAYCQLYPYEQNSMFQNINKFTVEINVLCTMSAISFRP